MYPPDCSLFYFGIGEVPLGGHNGKGVRVVNRVRKSPTRTMGTDSGMAAGQGYPIPPSGACSVSRETQGDTFSWLGHKPVWASDPGGELW